MERYTWRDIQRNKCIEINTLSKIQREIYTEEYIQRNLNRKI